MLYSCLWAAWPICDSESQVSGGKRAGEADKGGAGVGSNLPFPKKKTGFFLT